MKDFIEFLTSNWDLVTSAIGAVIAAFVAIAKLTPTKKDDIIAEKLDKKWKEVHKK